MSKCRLSSEERRQDILANAARVFSQKGLAGSRTRDIAVACDINEALIYKHFASKEELFRASLEHLQDGILRDVRSRINQAENGLEAVKISIEKNLENLIVNSELRGFILHSVASTRLSDELKDWIKSWFDQQRSFIESLIRQGIEDGSIRNDIDVETVLWCVTGIAWTGLFALQMEQPRDSIARVTKSVTCKLIENICSN